jgi:two-component system, NarL family, response regulator LiaR
MPKKALLIYGLVCAVVMVVLNAGKFSVFAGQLHLEFYIIIAGVVFTFLGIFLGIQLVSTKTQKLKGIGLDKSQNHVQLTPRELEVLQLMAEGLANQEIADKLFVSLPTIKSHSSNIYSKMDVKRRTQAIQLAMNSGLL